MITLKLDKEAATSLLNVLEGCEGTLDDINDWMELGHIIRQLQVELESHYFFEQTIEKERKRFDEMILQAENDSLKVLADNLKKFT